MDYKTDSVTVKFNLPGAVSLLRTDKNDIELIEAECHVDKVFNFNSVQELPSLYEMSRLVGGVRNRNRAIAAFNKASFETKLKCHCNDWMVELNAKSYEFI